MLLLLLLVVGKKLLGEEEEEEGGCWWWEIGRGGLMVWFMFHQLGFPAIICCTGELWTTPLFIPLIWLIDLFFFKQIIELGKTKKQRLITRRKKFSFLFLFLSLSLSFSFLMLCRNFVRSSWCWLSSYSYKGEREREDGGDTSCFLVLFLREFE